MRDYQFTSPSLGGILHHDSIVYEGIRRPETLLRIMDRKIIRNKDKAPVVFEPSEQKVIEDYFAALKVLEASRYLEPTENIRPLAHLGHRKLVADLVFLLKQRNEGATPAMAHRIAALIRKAEQLGRDIAKL